MSTGCPPHNVSTMTLAMKSSLLLAVLLQLSASFTCSWTELDVPFSVDCPSGEGMYRWKSIHHNREEDRSFQFSCTKVGAGTTGSHEWVGDYDGGADAEIAPTCGADKFLVSVMSQHWDRCEDRSFRLQCARDDDSAQLRKPNTASSFIHRVVYLAKVLACLWRVSLSCDVQDACFKLCAIVPGLYF